MPFGLFEFLFTPYGLSNFMQTFQQIMDCTIDGLQGSFAYIDNSCVGSPDRQTHLIHLEAFFAALAANGFSTILKNVFLQSQLWNFLVTQFFSRFGPHGRAYHHNQSLSRCQAVATFSRHGKVLPPFSSQLRQGSVPFNRSPEGQPKNSGAVLPQHRRLPRTQSASLPRWYQFNTPSRKQNFL
jgi:hypothetical protein